MSAFRAVVAAFTLCIPAAVPVFMPGAAAQGGLSSAAWTELHASRVRFAADRTRTAGGKYFAALEIAMAEGWKTYWRMPGDSGVPPSFDWTGSTNVAATKVLYPAPTRMPEAGGVAIGYKKAILLPIEITPKDPSKPIDLKLTFEFGVCREICIPATATFALAIPLASAGPTAPEIAAAIERVPRTQDGRRKTDPELKRIQVVQVGSSPKLSVEASFDGDAKGADVFIEAPEGFYVPIPARVGTDAGGVVRFEAELGRDLAQDLKGKPLTITLVSDAGATEVQSTFP